MMYFKHRNFNGAMDLFDFSEDLKFLNWIVLMYIMKEFCYLLAVGNNNTNTKTFFLFNKSGVTQTNILLFKDIQPKKAFTRWFIAT